MPLDPDAVDHVARLARLDLEPDERRRIAAELTQILEHAERIQALDLDGVEPTSHALALTNALRPDEVTPSLSPETALAGAPLAEDRRFRVPRIIEEP
jgi:aspartyl-tRNA(Asn)/glutamyl-tRNA(Gln) amidotransferase subunit C